MQDSVLAESLHGLSVPQNKTPVKVFGSGSLLFRQKKAIKYKIWTLFRLVETNDKFFLSIFGKQDSVLLQALHGPSVS